MQEQPQGIDFSEIFGMIIAIIAVVYTIATAFIDIFRKRPSQDVEVSKEKKALYKELAKAIGKDEDEEEEEEERIMVQKKQVSPSPSSIQKKGWRKPEEKFVFHSSIESLHPKTAIDERALEIHLRSGDELVNKTLQELSLEGPQVIKRKASPLKLMMKGLGSKRTLIIATELIRPPVGFRSAKDNLYS